MRKDKLKRIISVFLISTILLPMFEIFTNKVFAASNKKIEITFNENIDNNFELLKSTKQHKSIEVWHYSGNYWGNSKGIIATDKQINNDLTNLEPAVIGKGGYSIELDYPEEVKKAIKDGKKVILQVKSYGTHPIGKYINFVEDTNKHTLSTVDNKLKFKTYPKFNYEEDELTGKAISYKAFNLKTKVTIPFVRQGFGSNGYSIFARDGRRHFGASYSAWGEGPKSNKIHPTIINPNGTLKPGYKIKTTSGMKNSGDIKIGNGTFNGGGAVGLHFDYPFEFNFYIEKENKSNIIMRELELIDPETNKVIIYIHCIMI